MDRLAGYPAGPGIPDDGTVELFDDEQPEVRDRLSGYEGLAAVARSPDGRRFATAGTDLTTPEWSNA